MPGNPNEKMRRPMKSRLHFFCVTLILQSTAMSFSLADDIKISEKHANGTITTTELRDSTLVLNGKKINLSATTSKRYEKELVDLIQSSSKKSDHYCLPDERWEIHSENESRVFCRNRKFIQTLSEVISNLKIESISN